MSLTTLQLQNYAWISQASYLDFFDLQTNDLESFKDKLILALETKGDRFILAN